MNLPRVLAVALPLGLTLGGAAETVAHTGPLDCLVPTVDDRCEAWTAVYDNPSGHASFGEDEAVAVTISPQGDRVYVTGISRDDRTAEDVATIGYDAATGRELWVARHHGGKGDDRPRALAVGPDGRAVYVAGAADILLEGGYHLYPSGGDYVILAHDAGTGARIWAVTYDGPGQGKDMVESIVLSPDGSRLYATGWSEGEEDPDFATLALDAATGKVQWISRFDAGDTERGQAIGLSPDGARVFVTGYGGTVAYDSGHDDTDEERHGGEVLWKSADSLADMWWPRNGAVNVSPDGFLVFATGPHATAAYDTAAGARRWLVRHRGLPNNQSAASTRDAGWSASLAPDGARLYLAGWAWGEVFSDARAMALDAATGVGLWSKRYPEGWVAHAVAAPTGSRVYITDGDCATYAYEGGSGAQVWAARHIGPFLSTCDAAAVSADGRGIYAAGAAGHEPGLLATRNASDYLTLAYEAG